MRKTVLATPPSRALAKRSIDLRASGAVLDLNVLLTEGVDDPLLVQVESGVVDFGDGVAADIAAGDILVVDRAGDPAAGDLVLVEDSEGFSVHLFGPEGPGGLYVVDDRFPILQGVIRWILSPRPRARVLF